MYNLTKTSTLLQALFAFSLMAMIMGASIPIRRDLNTSVESRTPASSMCIGGSGGWGQYSDALKAVNYLVTIQSKNCLAPTTWSRISCVGKTGIFIMSNGAPINTICGDFSSAASDLLSECGGPSPQPHDQVGGLYSGVQASTGIHYSLAIEGTSSC